eukprot:CAMPEP_0183409854 /NCGR_PEP_ID=MMETSP0370-20130417/19147_1 /TAXON_ID=268820 /ORGANISM="Peridinium aciculiferum, Strain PAER-2" /LENGTH=49 /DNA_ID= /DNA_START= /DNA_END= /DNA_ORIENTATION=
MKHTDLDDPAVERALPRANFDGAMLLRREVVIAKNHLVVIVAVVLGEEA